MRTKAKRIYKKPSQRMDFLKKGSKKYQQQQQQKQYERKERKHRIKDLFYEYHFLMNHS